MNRATRTRIALFLDLYPGYWSSVVRGVARYARLRHAWMFRALPPTLSGLRRLRAWHPQAVIGSPSSWRVARRLAELGVPVVNAGLERPGLGFMQISNDDAAIGRMAAHHFAERRLRHLAYVRATGDLGDRRRERGLSAGARSAGASCSVFGPRGAERELALWLRALPKPVGVLAYNDGVAVRVIEVCHDLGARVPDEIAVLGVDNTDAVTDICDPPLSSIIVAAERIGDEAARAVERALRTGKRARRPIHVPPLGVATRQSTDIVAVDDAAVARALRFIAEHSARGPSVSDISRAAGLDRRALERRFRAVLERTPFEEVRRVQLEHVKQLLTDTELPMARIAEYAGFSSDKHLSQAFSHAEGIPPSAYRRQRRASAPTAIARRD